MAKRATFCPTYFTILFSCQFLGDGSRRMAASCHLPSSPCGAGRPRGCLISGVRMMPVFSNAVNSTLAVASFSASRQQNWDVMGGPWVRRGCSTQHVRGLGQNVPRSQYLHAITDGTV